MQTSIYAFIAFNDMKPSRVSLFGALRLLISSYILDITRFTRVLERTLIYTDLYKSSF